MAQGYIQIKYRGEWGTICDDLFDNNNNAVKVVCRMMGWPIPEGDIGKEIIM